MNATRSTKLSTKLGLAFAVMLALTLLVGGVALNRLVQVNAAAQDIAGNWLPSIKVLGEIRTTANQLRRAEANLLLALDAADLDSQVKKLDELRVVQQGLLARYEPLISSADERQHFEQFARHRQAWIALRPRLIELARGGEKAAPAGRALFHGDSSSAFTAMASELGALVDINDKGSKVAAAEAAHAYDTARTWIFAIGGLSLVIACVLALLIVRNVTGQIGGEPADAVALARRVADGDLSLAIHTRPGDDRSLLAALRRMQESLSAIVGGVRGNADGVATASAQIAQGNQDLSSRTEEQASALQQTAASMKQLAGTVQQNADNAEQGNALAEQASGVAARGGEVVGQVVQTMKGINESSRKIADIISVIDGIAFQTNILALNAAVEAARAGEQGRGFAVVASEVRNLAQRSADAAKEIKALITDSVGRVEQGTALVDQAGATMGEVVDSISRVTQLMAGIAAASREQSAGVAQIGEAVNQMDQATQQNAALVEQSAAAADSLKSQAAQLVGAVSVFRVAGSPAANAPMAPTLALARPAARPAGLAAPRPAALAAPRPGAASRAPASRTVPALPAAAPAAARTGTDDDWQSF
ncbi:MULTISPECIES: methyl-accepting chemotaxis protein [Ramlibacter]|uniref:MCP four helix bundle domain-containing protein n=1 Tax=Ramlibacter aquaticus TaxID=2780094 RepID=A0ABR9SA15_9BURK|nr:MULTISPECIES: methyl-accepting chemotaxis protein [Ramlibacter]MBE7939193.1 MCP four helix bundle domain-containing protein [Ramlibacter aquaticus]